MIASPSYRQTVSIGQSPPPDDPSLELSLASNGKQEPPRRRSSFSFLHRTKSKERLSTTRSTSGGKLSKRQRGVTKERELRREQVPQQPPKIPDIPHSILLQAFGGEVPRRDSAAVTWSKGQDYHQGRSISRNSRDITSPNMYNVPIPPIPGNMTVAKGGYVDSYPRTESMTHRGRYSYASSAVSTINSPRRVRRRKDPTPFNILVIGASNSGKTSFLNFLRTSLGPPTRKQRSQLQEDIFDANPASSIRAFPSFTSQYLETEIEKERIGLTLWDSHGLEASIVDLQLREMSSFLESKFEDTFSEEMKVFRSPGAHDTHIHCVFLLLDPGRLDANIVAARRSTPKSTGYGNGNSFVGSAQPSLVGGLDENLDLQVLRTLHGKTTVVPVIAKADTITSAHMAHLKQAVWESLRRSNINPLEALGLDDGDAEPSNGIQPNDHAGYMGTGARERSDVSQLDSSSDTSSSFSASDFDLAKPPRASTITPSGSPLPDHARTGVVDTPYLPLSIISPDMYEPDVPGRRFPWGFADPYDATHCDFLRLKEMVFTEWRGELREASRDMWYEGWRTSRLNNQSQRADLVGQAR